MTKLITAIAIFLTATIYTQELIPSHELTSDANLLWQSINELHPGAYRHVDTIELRQAYDHLLNQFSENRTQKEAFKYLSEFIVKLKCGHTYLNPHNQPNDIIKSITSEEVLLPFSFNIMNRKVVVENSLTTDIFKNDVIKCINDVNVESIIAVSYTHLTLPTKA